MKNFIGMATAVVMASSCAFTQLARADSTNATCEFYSHGDKKKDRSGPCSFSQRQGYVDIGLSNGKTFNLSPGNKPDHFKDQEDHKVVRETGGANKQVYKWDQKKIVVTFNAAAPAADQGGKAKLSDLEGMDSIKAIDVITSRGFTSVDSISEGDSLYGIYYNARTRQCVQLSNARNRVVSADDIHTHPKCR